MKLHLNKTNRPVVFLSILCVLMISSCRLYLNADGRKIHRRVYVMRTVGFSYAKFKFKNDSQLVHRTKYYHNPPVGSKIRIKTIETYAWHGDTLIMKMDCDQPYYDTLLYDAEKSKFFDKDLYYERQPWAKGLFPFLVRGQGMW
ncbi:MAG: hypothetical protein RLZZ262_929 [Bacteroidota bacterium]|jgi:hypothetical protein